MHHATIFLLFCGAVVLDLAVDAKLSDLGQQQGFFEGDIEMPKRARNGILAAQRWPNNTIYYAYGTAWSQDQIDMIQGAMKEIQDNTCIRFVERTNQRNYLSIKSGNGCSAYVGYAGIGAVNGVQYCTLGRGCWSHSTVVHELLHTVGLWHEQSRYDRDDYLSINLDNVEFCQRYNFDIQPGASSNTYGVPFNYLSIMHYSKTAFAPDRVSITITPLDPSFTDLIGNVEKGAPSDYDKVQRIYQCGAYKNFVAPPVKLATKASTTNEGVCVNVDCYDDCPMFAANMNYCQEQPEYMRKWCPKTCDSCSKPAATTTTAAPFPPNAACNDNEAECPKLAADGNCKAGNGWTEYMTRSCPKSCGLCSTSGCTDKVKDEGLCDAWASVGYCAQLSVQKDCSKTCGKC